MISRIRSVYDKCGLYAPLAFIQYVLVIAFNFLYTDNAVDSDSAKLFRHALEMHRNHTLNISDWVHTTTMEWDTSALIAAPLMYLTDDVYLAFAIANTIILTVLLYLVIRLFNRYGQSLKTAFMACNLLLIPYSFGMLDYFNMLMFNGSQYVFRIMIPIALLILIKTPAASRKGVENIVIAVATLALILIASISSGVYILVACIIPVLAVMVFNMLGNDSFRHYDLYQIVTAGAALLAALAGTVISLKSGEAGFGNSMSLLRWYDLRYYVQCFAEGYFRLMGAMPGAIADESVAVFSPRGIAFLFKLLIAVIMILALISNIRSIHSGVRMDITKALGIIAFVNLVIVLVCETRYNSQNSTLEHRYLLPAVVPMLLCVAPRLELWRKKWSRYINNAVSVVFILGVAYTTIICTQDAHSALDQYAYCDEIIDRAKSMGYDTVIFLDDRVTSECCRIKDTEGEYESYASSVSSMDIVDYYAAARESDFYDDHHLLFAVSGTSLGEIIGEDKASVYTYVDSMLWFDIYSAEEFVL